jgi:hypothetical protein
MRSASFAQICCLGARLIRDSSKSLQHYNISRDTALQLLYNISREKNNIIDILASILNRVVRSSTNIFTYSS